MLLWKHQTALISFFAIAKPMSFGLIATIALGLSFFAEESAFADELGYLGPIGTYSEQATKVYQSKTPGLEKIIPYKTITAVTTAIKSGELKRGLIPIENSDSGFVAETYGATFKLNKHTQL